MFINSVCSYFATQAIEKEHQKKEEIKKQRKLEQKKKEMKGKGREGKDQSATRKRRASGHVFFEEDESSAKRGRCELD